FSSSAWSDESYGAGVREFFRCRKVRPLDRRGAPSYTVLAGACSRLDSRHVGLLALTIDELVLLRDLYQGLREGRDLSALAATKGVSRKKCYELLNRVHVALRRGSNHKAERSTASKRSSTRTLRQVQGAEPAPELIFYEGLSPWIEEFLNLLERSSRGYSIVRIQGGEFSILWLLPRVLKESKFLEQYRDVELDIVGGTWQESLANLIQGRTDLGLGPLVPKERVPTSIALEEVLTVQRAMICHKEHH